MPIMQKYLKPLLGLSKKIQIQRETHRAMSKMRAFIEGARWAECKERHLRTQESLSNKRLQADTMSRMETVCDTLVKNTEQLNSAFKQMEIMRSEIKSAKEKRQLVADVPPLKYQTKANPWRSEKLVLDLHLGIVTFNRNDPKGFWEAQGDKVQTRHPDYCLWKDLVKHMKYLSKGLLLPFATPLGKKYVCEWLNECRNSDTVMNREETTEFMMSLFESE